MSRGITIDRTIITASPVTISQSFICVYCTSLPPPLSPLLSGELVIDGDTVVRFMSLLSDDVIVLLALLLISVVCTALI